MTSQDYHIDKETLLGKLTEARQLVSLYDEQNRINPAQHYNHGGVDSVALNLLERGGYFITIGIKANNNWAKIYGMSCYPGSDNFTATNGQTVEYRLEGINGTTIARFVDAVCDSVIERVNNGNSETKKVMMQNAKAHANRTKQYIVKANNNRTFLT